MSTSRRARGLEAHLAARDHTLVASRIALVEVQRVVSIANLDAIHLASARQVGADELLAYDRRLASAATAAGMLIAQPGR